MSSISKSVSSLPHILARAHRLRTLIERESRRPHANGLRLMRLKSLLLRVQRRLASVTGVWAGSIRHA